MENLMQIYNRGKQQYFELKEIQKYQLEKHGSIIYRKFKSKIGVIYQQTQFFDIHYFENEELKYYKRVEFIWKNYWEHEVNSEHVQVCFCGELKYIFYFPYEGNLLQICLQTGEEKKYTFENYFPYLIDEVKNSNLIILQSSLETELRDAQSFNVLLKINKFVFLINDFFYVKSPYQFFERQLISSKYIQKFNLNLNHFFSELIQLDNFLIIQNLRLRSLQLKGKILRKILRRYDQQTEVIISVRLKKYHNQCYLKLKAQFFVSFQEYDLMKGELQYNQNMKQIFSGFLTFREEQFSYYFLRYVPVNHDQNDKTITIQKFDSQLASISEWW